MSVPSMVHRSGDSLIVRSVVSGDALFGSAEKANLDDSQDVDDSTVVNEKELPECKIKRNYSCTNCEYFTQNPRDYLYHLRDVHREKVKIYECPNCLYASKHFQKLLRHSKMVHGSSGGVEMPDTGRNTKPRKRPLSHEDEDSASSIPDEEYTYDGEEETTASNEKSTAVFKCSVCSFTARNQAQLTKHEREEHIKTKFFRCTKCTYVTHMKARFTKHVKYHSMPMIKCDMCDFRTPYKWNLDRHCKNHNGRGAFKCSACNFTADIKQSLTVHEMNHHVPPVGQAAGLGVGRRRNKVGASDATAAEDAAAQAQVARRDTDSASSVERSNTTKDVEKVRSAPPKTKSTTKKAKTSIFNTDQSSCAGNFGSDFIHPDDIIHHANGNVYIKNKCKLCNFKSAWDSEMAKHEKKMHGILREEPAKVIKKTQRPIPNLIPIPLTTSMLKSTPRLSGPPVLKAAEPLASAEPTMSQETIKEICAKSANSALKDFASLFGSEGLFNEFKNNSESNSENNKIPKMPDLIPASVYTSTPKVKPSEDNFKIKNASFFDTLKEKLLISAGNSANNLVCKYCGHQSKCLTEQVTHQKQCGKESNSALYITPVHNTSSSRCQYCRQRCKSTVDLINHLRQCPEALKTIKLEQESNSTSDRDDDREEGELRIDEDGVESEPEMKPHPMENKVFVWNNIEVPMDIEVDDSNYEYQDDRVDDNGSLDLSVRIQSPGEGSDNSYLGVSHEYNIQQTSPVPPPSGGEKIPTHGNDITVAQHKRVFKCPHCTFWASTASRFHVHIVGHLNKKPFECSLCAYRSNWRWDITKHIKLKSVRDPAHESAKVLMTDETGRRNYSKYNAYLTEIPVSGEQSMETSGGSGTRQRHQDHHRNVSPAQNDITKLNRAAPITGDMSPVIRTQALRPPPPLKAADESFFAKKRTNSESKKTHFKCKKCNFKDPSRETLLAHVKGHYPQSPSQGTSLSTLQQTQQEVRIASPETDEASVNNGNSATEKGQAPFRCGHCNQVSNWKHVIQRHCRLKHSGDIRVVSSKNGQEKLEIEKHFDEPDHIDVPQTGTFKCNTCPFSNDDNSEFEEHLKGHTAKPDSIMKCHYCKFFVSRKEDLVDHLKLHGIDDTDEFLSRMLERSGTDGDNDKKFRCLICPYVTNSKSQYTYHRQFHRPRGNQYNCSKCSYNVSKRHLLHQHLKVHGINVTPQKQNGDVIDLDEISDEIEEVPSGNATNDAQNFADIPLVWVSKDGKFCKKFKCRYCPHVNSRKVNIQEHEKMHSTREKNPSSTRTNDVEHRCTECNYICNNAGVLSSHSKVHQGLCGTVHSLVDFTKSDEEQIKELSNSANLPTQYYDNIIQEDYENAESVTAMESDSNQNEQSDILYFCSECPARFLKDSEYNIHVNFHSRRLFYRCDHCTYTARQKPHLLAHNKVHTSEYQEETKILKENHMCKNQPRVYPMSSATGELVWKVYESSKPNDLDIDIENLASVTKSSRSTQSIPLSGTELFQQKSEAQQKHNAEKAAQQSKEPSPPPQKPADPQFGTLMHGNPKFIYPTYLKNGKMKEKRYKCHKCPSAFEKREQYKVHLGLHGSKQRYQCEHCDYSVKYYANYVQHSKKHKMNEDAQAAKKSEDENEEAEDTEEAVTKNDENLSSSDNVKEEVTSPKNTSTDERKLFWCSNCPYTNYRKDAVDNHQKRHKSVSGIESNYTCQHCDYSVPQQHFLREHVKLHFSPNKVHTVTEYMDCDNLKLVAYKYDPETQEANMMDGELIFEEQGSNENEKSYLPPLSAEVAERFNNNEGEKQFVNRKTGECISSSDKQSSECKME